MTPNSNSTSRSGLSTSTVPVQVPQIHLVRPDPLMDFQEGKKALQKQLSEGFTVNFEPLQVDKKENSTTPQKS